MAEMKTGVLYNATTGEELTDLDNVPEGTNIWISDSEILIDGEVYNGGSDFTTWHTDCFSIVADNHEHKINCGVGGGEVNNVTTEEPEVVKEPVTQTTTIQPEPVAQPVLAETGIGGIGTVLVGAAVIVSALVMRVRGV